ncbi:MAG: secondary thiamine-phosphate synthase enzyme YjbQ [Candidatus Krumholzibacteriia bacterium]
MRTFQVDTTEHAQLVDITAQVTEAAAKLGVSCGAVLVHVPHTTAAVTVNEGADPDVPRDLLRRLDLLVPWHDPVDRHGEGNSAAHLKSSLIGCNQVLPVTDGRLRLGTWQTVWFCEFDGPRRRRVEVSTIASDGSY